MSMITSEEFDLARRVAYRVASKWPMVEMDDAQSELYLWLVEHADDVIRYRVEPGGEAKLFVALRRECGKYCAKETQARTGAPLDASLSYSKQQVERVLPFIFEDLPQQVVVTHPQTGAAVHAQANGGGEALAMLLDVRTSFLDLPAEVRMVLTMRFRDELTFKEIGALTGLSDAGAKKRVDRGVARIQAVLG
jgi:DNA-directed RNA polymerase specialized sigma24 family protein